MSGPSPARCRSIQSTGWGGVCGGGGAADATDEVRNQWMTHGCTSCGFMSNMPASSSGLAPCTQHMCTPPPNCSQWGFFHEGCDTKSWNIKRLPWLCGPGVHYSSPHGSVSQPWGSGKLSTTLSTLPTSPSSDRSTWSLSQKSQCPSGIAGKLDKWKARGGKVGRPVILY